MDLSYVDVLLNESPNIMQKVVINRIWGGFTLSKPAIKKLSEIKGENYKYNEETIKRDDNDLIRIVEELGEEVASGDVYGIKMKLKLLSFKYNPEIEYFIVSKCDGIENVVIVNKNDSTYRFVL